MKRQVTLDNLSRAVDALDRARIEVQNAQMWLLNEDNQATPHWSRALSIRDKVCDLKVTLEAELASRQ